jgi:short-subunit dehydrogenase
VQTTHPKELDVHLAGSHVVVTGASRGIGLEVARVLADRGARLSIVARNRDLLGKVADELGAHPVPTDLCDLEQVQALLPTAREENGPVDLVINNAAINIPGALVHLSAEQVRTVLTTNLLAPLEICRQALQEMTVRDHGMVVNVSSLAGELAMRNVIPYSASKAGLAIATRALQRELRGTRVKAQLVVLGVVDTDMIADTNADPVGAQIAKRFAALPSADAHDVATRIVEGIERGRKGQVIPPIGAPFHHIRLIPTRIADAILVGSPRSLGPAGGVPR